MKRLTDKRISFSKNVFTVVSKDEYKKIINTEKPSFEEIYKRLVQIENILGDDYDLDRLRELVGADEKPKYDEYLQKVEHKLNNVLLGAKLIEITNEFFIVEKDKKTYKIIIKQYNGGGYNEVIAKFVITDEINPVITNIKIEKYEEYMSGEAVITLYSESNEIATLKSISSSRSGCQYGAFVRIVCKELDIDEIVTEW